MKKWEILNKKKPKNTEEVIEILLNNRGLKTKKQIEEFLNPSLNKVNCKNVDINTQEVEKSIKRIEKAINESEQIVIYGDYDVDGIAGTAVLWGTIYKHYKKVMPFIPHRKGEGYGLSKKGIDNITNDIPGVKLIITVDNGVVAHDSIKYANDKGIDVIVTDHHVRAKESPAAYSIVHTTALCGAGVAYLLSLAFEKSEYPDENDDRLTLVALATVADMVPLKDANRALVKFGIERLRKTRSVGLASLFKEANIRQAEIDAYHIGHIIAPRLNAAGRIGHAMDALRLLCTSDVLRATRLAKELSLTNKDRQLLTTEGAELADKISGKITKEEKLIIISDRSYNEGVIGLVASRIVEKHYRPAIVISEGEEISKGSARSIAGFNIIESIREHKDLLLEAGGHPMAAGFTIKTSKISLFKEAIIKKSSKLLNEKMFERKIKIDMNLPFDLITNELYEKIKKLSPFGIGNPEPIFVNFKVRLSEYKIVGREGEHIKLILSDKKGNNFNAIYFQGADKFIKKSASMDVVFSLSKNTWNNSTTLNLNVKDLLTA